MLYDVRKCTSTWYVQCMCCVAYGSAWYYTDLMPGTVSESTATAATTTATIATAATTAPATAAAAATTIATAATATATSTTAATATTATTAATTVATAAAAAAAASTATSPARTHPCANCPSCVSPHHGRATSTHLHRAATYSCLCAATRDCGWHSSPVCRHATSPGGASARHAPGGRFDGRASTREAVSPCPPC